MSEARSLDAERLRRLVGADSFVTRLEVLSVVGSTNDEVRDRACQGAPPGTVVLAEEQNAGRGRLGRSWHSPPGRGLYLSVLVRPPARTAEITRYTVTSALALCEACLEAAGVSVVIRWPNDLLHAGRKLAGTLTEVRSVGPKVEALVIGSGVNVNHGVFDFPPGLRPSATSLRLALGGRRVDRERLAAAYLCRLGRLLRLLEEGRWEEIVEAWTLHAPGADGASVAVWPDGRESPSFHGVTRGIDEAGALRVERQDGRLISVSAVGSVVPMES